MGRRYFIALVAFVSCTEGYASANFQSVGKVDFGGALLRPSRKSDPKLAATLFPEVEQLLTASADKSLDFCSPFSEKVYKLGEVMAPEDTKRFLKLIELATSKPLARKELLIGLSFHGTDAECLPIYIKAMKSMSEAPYGSVYEFVAGAAYNVHELEGVATGYVMRSLHPLAIQYKLSLLKNPKAFPEFRNMAYVSIAGSHDKQALSAIREMRSKGSFKTLLSDGTPVTRSPNEDEVVLATALDGLIRFLAIDKGKPWYIYLPANQSPFKFLQMDRDFKIAGANEALTWRNSQSAWFTRPYRDFSDKENKDRSAILWSPDKRRARVGIRGGLDDAAYDVELERIDGVWFVVMAKMAWVA